MKTDWTKNIHPGHHAYLVTGTEEKTIPELVEFLKKDWKIETIGNPDFITHIYSTLYIDDCHKITEENSTKPVGNSGRIFLIYFGFMTRESANALLKLFEEPTSDTTFFVVTPNPERLPPTLKSRFTELKTSRKSDEGVMKEAEKFIDMNIGERFEYSKKLAGNISDEKQTRADALAILEAIEEKVFEKYPINAENSSTYNELEKCRSYLKDQSCSVKLLFDDVALSLSELFFNNSGNK